MMKYLLSILLSQMVSLVSYAQTNNPKTVPLNKVILSVNADVHATVLYEKEGTKINEELNSQLIETVEYGIVRYKDNKNMRLDPISNKNRMTISGKGSVAAHVEGIGDNKDNYTFSISPEVPYPLTGINLITDGQPYKIQVYISDFYRDCSGSASGTSRFVSGWEGDAPTWQTLPIEKVQTYVSTAVRNVFESPEDMELAMKGELTELQRKLQGSFTPRADGGFFASGKVSHAYNKTDETGMIFNGAVTISWSVQCGDLPKDSSPQITLNGCTELSIGELSEVTAKAGNEGGSFRFWAEPEEMFSIETTGATVKLMGTSPGRGKLFVEYTSASGKTKQTSIVASCVQVQSYNGGQKIPQIPLFNVNGEKLDGILKVPVETKPNEATDLIRFVPADPGVLTAVGLGDVIALQGVHPGKTTLKAATDCGATIGPLTEVEVVNCNDETIAELERMRQVAMKSLTEANDDLKRIAGSEEFEKAKEEIVESLVELIAKAGLTIVASGKSPTAAIENATKIAEAGSAVSEMIASGSKGEFYFNAAKAAVGELGGKAVSSLIGIAEVKQAAQKFGDNWAKLIEYENTLKNTLERFEKADKDLQKYLRLQQICKGEKPSPQKKEAPKTEAKPDPTKPTPPVKPTPKTEDSPAKQAQTKEAPAKDEVLIDPERPPVPSQQVGLPYEPGDCGCSGSKMLTATAKDFSTLGAGLKNLGACFENFTNTSLTDYQKALTELSELTGSLSLVSQTDSVAFLVKAKESKPQLDALIGRVKAYDLAGKAILDKMKKCPENVSIGIDVLKSVEQITVDSIKAKY
jgi:hypothetical protein